jgi:hypothetical protein
VNDLCAESRSSSTARPLAHGSREPVDLTTRDEDLLLTGSAREVLARIVGGDPLAIRARVAARLRARALLIDLERAALRTFALVARDSLQWRRRPDLETFLSERVERALDQLLGEESAALLEPAGPRPASTVPATFDHLARPLGLDPRGLQRACARFHTLAPEVREAFFLVLLEDRSPESLAADRPAAARLARRARRALDALRGARPAPPHPSHPLHPTP